MVAVDAVVPKKAAIRMLRLYGAQIAALAIDSEEAARRFRDLTYDGLGVPLDCNLTGYLAALHWNAAMRMWACSAHMPGVRVANPDDDWALLELHGRLRVHQSRRGLSDSASDRQRDCQLLADDQPALFPTTGATGGLTSVEVVSSVSNGRVTGVCFAVVIEDKIVWRIGVNMAAAAQQLLAWRDKDASWLRHNARVAPFGRIADVTGGVGAVTTVLTSRQPGRTFRPRQQPAEAANADK